MDTRHQVFISSTFRDLIDERREVIEALLEMDAIPAGMELFAAGNTDQWTLIQQVIDQSDYYIVIVGGRYGSTTAEGISYTEKEYDYAVDQEIPVMGFLHADPSVIPSGKTELDPAARLKLDAFRAKVQTKMTRLYSSPAELGAVVSRGLHKMQKDFPRPGWVRGDNAMTAEVETLMAEMRAEIAELRQQAAEAEADAKPRFDNLSAGDDTFQIAMAITGRSKGDKSLGSSGRKTWVWTVHYPTTWNEILEAIGPTMMDETSERKIKESLQMFGETLVKAQTDRWPSDIDTASKWDIDRSTVDDVLVQLFALGLIDHGARKRTMSDSNRYWRLTPPGEDYVMRLRAQRRPTQQERRVIREAELDEMTVVQLRSMARDYRLPVGGLKGDLIRAIIVAEKLDQ